MLRVFKVYFFILFQPKQVHSLLWMSEVNHTIKDDFCTLNYSLMDKLLHFTQASLGSHISCSPRVPVP